MNTPDPLAELREEVAELRTMLELHNNIVAGTQAHVSRYLIAKGFHPQEVTRLGQLMARVARVWPVTWQALVAEFTASFPQRTEADLRAIFLAYIADGADGPAFKLAEQP